MIRAVGGWRKWFRWGGNALGDGEGAQDSSPTSNLINGTSSVGIDSALQISAVWAAVALWAKTISSLPLMIYESKDGKRALARESSLWALLHESPNSRMTPSEFWTAMILNLVLRGNGYARIERDKNGEAFALWPMSADQIEVQVLANGKMAYIYRVGNDVVVYAQENILHLREMGNGSIGLSRLDYMRATTSEVANSQKAANDLFANGGKPSGILMVDKSLTKGQRATVMERFKEMAAGTVSRLIVLEHDLKYQQINLTPLDMQLLSTRQWGIQEIGRWFGIPSILLNQTEGTTTLGSSSGEIIEAFHKLSLRPALVSIEQAIRKRVMTVAQRHNFICEYNLDALLRASLKDRMEIYAKATQNGIFSRNFCRQLENEPPIEGGDELTAQINLAPLHMLGKIKPTGGSNGTQDATAQ